MISWALSRNTHLQLDELSCSGFGYFVEYCYSTEYDMQRAFNFVGRWDLKVVI